MITLVRKSNEAFTGGVSERFLVAGFLIQNSETTVPIERPASTMLIGLGQFKKAPWLKPARHGIITINAASAALGRHRLNAKLVNPSEIAGMSVSELWELATRYLIFSSKNVNFRADLQIAKVVERSLIAAS